MRNHLAIAVIAFALLAVACGDGGGSQDVANDGPTSASEAGDETQAAATPDPGHPGDAMEALLRMQFRGQFSRAWDELHPGHQELVTRSDYEECQDSKMGDVAGLELGDFEVVETYEDHVDVNGAEVEATAITWSVEFRRGSETQKLTDTSRLIDVDGRWRWLLSDPDEYVDC